MSSFFKLVANGVDLDTFDNTYFELKKGTIIGGAPNLLHKEWSTNITLPATEKNVQFFRAHPLLGGNDVIFEGVIYFSNRAIMVNIQLVDFADEKITVYVVEQTSISQMYEGLGLIDAVEKFNNSFLHNIWIKSSFESELFSEFSSTLLNGWGGQMYSLPNDYIQHSPLNVILPNLNDAIDIPTFPSSMPRLVTP